MQNSNLDEISGTFKPGGLFSIGKCIDAAQNKYIYDRLKWFWKLNLFGRFIMSKTKLLYTDPNVEWNIKEGDITVTASFTQKLMLVGISYFWSWLLLKRRK